MENTNNTQRSEIFEQILEKIKLLKLEDSKGKDSYDHPTIAFELEKLFNSKLNDNNHKTLGNTTASQAKDNVKDIVFWGDGDTFKLISKASSKNEGWMKSTKAMEIKGIGCVVQVTTQQGSNIAEALTFVPNVEIKEEYEGSGMKVTDKVLSRKLVATKYNK